MKAPLRLHRAVIMAAGLLLPADLRAVRREQWHADLRDCADLGIPAHQISLGALAAAVRSPRRGTVMLPIGPLALGLRLRRTRAGLPLAVALFALLLIGLGLLIAP